MTAKKSIEHPYKLISNFHIFENKVLNGSIMVEFWSQGTAWDIQINKLFLDKGSRVLGYSPQFSDYIDDVNSYGGIYDYRLMSAENNYKFILEPFLNKIQSGYKLIFLDNPNNPTGQIIPILTENVNTQVIFRLIYWMINTCFQAIPGRIRQQWFCIVVF